MCVVKIYIRCTRYKKNKRECAVQVRLVYFLKCVCVCVFDPINRSSPWIETCKHDSTEEHIRQRVTNNKVAY